MKLVEAYINKGILMPEREGHYLLYVTNRSGRLMALAAGKHWVVRYHGQRVTPLAQCVSRGKISIEPQDQYVCYYYFSGI